ncbi:MAG: hypothetical protein ACPGFB_11705 [Verrucomicrobiales bacterium]
MKSTLENMKSTLEKRLDQLERKCRNLRLILVGFVVIGAAFCLIPAAPNPARSSLQLVEGPLDLRYKLRTSSSTYVGTGSKPTTVNAIHFHNNYLVVETTESRGQVIPIDKIMDFTWSRKDMPIK